jgi:hypothetical protein
MISGVAAAWRPVRGPSGVGEKRNWNSEDQSSAQPLVPNTAKRLLTAVTSEQ